MSVEFTSSREVIAHDTATQSTVAVERPLRTKKPFIIVIGILCGACVCLLVCTIVFSVKSSEGPSVCNTAACIEAGDALRRTLADYACSDFYGFACDGFSERPQVLGETVWSLLHQDVIRDLKRLLEQEDEAATDAATKARQLYRQCVNADLTYDKLKPILQEVGLGDWPAVDARGLNADEILTKYTMTFGFLWPAIVDFGVGAVSLNETHNVFALKLQRPIRETGRAASAVDPERFVRMATSLNPELQHTLANSSAEDLRLFVDSVGEAEGQLERSTSRSTLDNLKPNFLIYKGTIDAILSNSPEAQPSPPVILEEGYLAEVSKLAQRKSYVVLLYNALGYRLVDAMSAWLSSEPPEKRADACVEVLMRVMSVPVANMHSDAYPKEGERNIIEDIGRKTKAAMIQLMDGYQTPLLKERKDVMKAKIEALSIVVGTPDSYGNTSAVDKYYENFSLKATFGDSLLEVLKMFGNPARFGVIGRVQEREDFTAVGDLLDYRPLAADISLGFTTNSLGVPLQFLDRTVVADGRPIALNYGAATTFLARGISASVGPLYGHVTDETGHVKRWVDEEEQQTLANATDCLQRLNQELLARDRLEELQVSQWNPFDAFNSYWALRASYKAFMDAGGLKEEGIKVDSRVFTAQQLFFLSLARMSCAAFGRQETESRLMKPLLTMPKYRVNLLLRNFAEFSEAFQCRERSPMNPTVKCVL